MLLSESMSPPTVFAGGIHRAGKTTLGRLLAEMLSTSHVTAGALIRETATASDDARLTKRDGAAPPLATVSLLAVRERECECEWPQIACAELEIPMWTVSGEAMPQEAAQAAAAHLRPLLSEVA
jgi:cytidylate kinase